MNYDIAIVGSGFAGSLLAMIARRAGRSVVLIEKGSHPRFAIGESSTPLSNLLLEELAVRYDLPRLLPFTKWGTWQEQYPQVACGLKRGFSFFHGTKELLVAASPNEAVADTHWYRPDFDHFFLQEAQAAGVDYFDQVALSGMLESDWGVTIEGVRFGKPLRFSCGFLVDATGPRGFVHQALSLSEAAFPAFPQTQALYTHFTGVENIAFYADDVAPYPVDDSALHHVFDGGWIWVLRFNNGVTSAGVVATQAVADALRFEEGEAAWLRVLERVPAARTQFARAKAALPFVHTRRLPFLADSVAGKRWAMLPSAAAFVDPLLSTGFPLTLLGVSRLAEIITNDWYGGIQAYAAQTKKEALAAAQLIGALYATMHDFELFRSVSFLYFAAASFSETARRLNKHHLADSFLLCDDPVFGPACARLCERARQSADVNAEILEAIESFNIAGLGNPNRHNWFPMDANDLIQGADKVGASREEIMRLLERSGFEALSLGAPQ